MVKAKFRCNCITDYGTQKQAVFSAVWDNGSGENKDFTDATPYGELKININSDRAASNYFQPNKNYYLLFEEAPNQ
jgi:hypothetical protein